MNADEGQLAGPIGKFRLGKTDAVVCLLLALATFAAYYPATRLGFIGFDDPYYVTANPYVRGGLTLRGLTWAFTSLQPDAWFPLTRLSHMLDYAVFGMNSHWHHAVSIAIHAGASLMLYVFLRRATRQLWPCAFVAAVFALHPLHVESVAWIAERKDVLCAFFWFAALWAWVRYTEHPTRGNYFDAILLFAAGLMSKPMIVTFPLLLAVLDFWPLRRSFSRKLVIEKLPLAAMSASVALLTMLAQIAAGAVHSPDALPLVARLQNALLTIFIYIGKTFWPVGLSIAYPWPAAEPVLLAAVAGAALIGVSVLAFLGRRDYPYLTAGWLWLLITLIPVIGIVQAGPQSRADRYMYVPMVGVLIMLTWGVSHILKRLPAAATPAAVLAGVVCLCLAALAWKQEGYWASSETLFRHAIDVNPQNDLAWEYLATTLSTTPGSQAAELASHREALRINPGFTKAHENLAWALYRAGQTTEAIAEYQVLLRTRPELAQARCDLGSILLSANQTGDAISQLEMALHYQPDSAEAHNNLAAALWRRQPGASQAIRQWEQALELRPAYPLAHTNLGLALLGEPGQLSEAIWHFNQALNMAPNDAAAHLGLAHALEGVPLSEAEASVHLQAARQLVPDSGAFQQLGDIRTDDGSAR